MGGYTRKRGGCLGVLIKHFLALFCATFFSRAVKIATFRQASNFGKARQAGHACSKLRLEMLYFLAGGKESRLK
jgi:hypothetical protein